MRTFEVILSSEMIRRVKGTEIKGRDGSIIIYDGDQIIAILNDASVIEVKA